METNIALISGITGQDGSLLADLLLKKGYDVWGLIRRTSNPIYENIEHIMKDIHLIDGDLSDQSSLINAVKQSCPDEIYNFASQSFVGKSWIQAEFTANVTGLGALRLFDAVRLVSRYRNKNMKIYQASSSEQFGGSPPPQNENTIFDPKSPYAAAKVFAHNMAIIYKESYGMFICSGILFNHESEHRGREFVTRKITDGAARIKLGLQKELILGNLESKRDWGSAKDYMEAVYEIMHYEKPDTFVIATGETHTIKEFADIAFKCVGLNWEDYVIIDKSLYRPVDVVNLRGDYSKARKVLGWEPKTSFKELIKIMVDADIERVKNEIK